MLPRPRGPLSARVLALLTGSSAPSPERTLGADPLTDDDLHLALYCCYELHYRGFDGVDPALEWDPELLALRGRMESVFERALRDETAPAETLDAGTVGGWLWRYVDGLSGPSLSGYMAAEGTLDELREFAVHRSAYQLKEADPHSFALPRVWGPAKSALVEIQADEYGGGRPGQTHA